MRAWAIALLFILPAVAAQTAPEDTTDYVWIIDNEDPEGDHVGPGAIQGANAPNTMNPESDILRIQMTDDANGAVIKVTFGTCDFEVPTGFAYIIMEAGEVEYTASYKDGCTDAKPADVDSVLAPVNGDPDSLVAGLRAVGVPEETAIYLFVDYEAGGIAPGDVVSFSRIHTGRQFTEPGRYTFGLDEADLFSHVLGDGAAAMTPAAPEAVTVVQDAVPGMELTFGNATHDTYLLNWTAQPGTLSIDAIVASGGFNLTFAQETQTVLANTTLEFDANQTGIINITLDGFIGTILIDAIQAPDGPSEVPGADPETDDSTQLDENETEVDAPADDQESPGLPLVAGIAALAVMALRRRQ